MLNKSSLLVLMLLIALICIPVFAQTNSEKVIVTSDRGSCPLLINSETVNVRDLLNNIESRLKALQLKAAQNPELRKELQPMLSELAALIKLFPTEVNLVPVDVQIMKPLDEYSFDYIIVKLAEMNDKQRIEYLQMEGQKKYYNMEQIGQIIELFDSTQSKFEAVRMLKSNIVDPENVWVIRDKFQSNTDAEKCEQIIFSWEE